MTFSTQSLLPTDSVPACSPLQVPATCGHLVIEVTNYHLVSLFLFVFCAVLILSPLLLEPCMLPHLQFPDNSKASTRYFGCKQYPIEIASWYYGHLRVLVWAWVTRRRGAFSGTVTNLRPCAIISSKTCLRPLYCGSAQTRSCPDGPTAASSTRALL